MHDNPGQHGLVLQDPQAAADLPLPQPQVVPPASVEVEDTARVADGQRPDSLLDGPADDGLGGLVLGLPDPTVVSGLDPALPAAPVVGGQDRAPHIGRRPQQPEAPARLRTGKTQPDPCGAMHHPNSIRIPSSRHDTIPHPGYDTHRDQQNYQVNLPR